MKDQDREDTGTNVRLHVFARDRRCSSKRDEMKAFDILYLIDL